MEILMIEAAVANFLRKNGRIPGWNQETIAVKIKTTGETKVRDVSRF